MKRPQNDLLTLLPRDLFARLLNKFLTQKDWHNLRATYGILQNYVNSHELDFLSDLDPWSQFAALCRLVLHINQIPLFYYVNRYKDKTPKLPAVEVVTALQIFTDRVFLSPEIAALSLSCLHRLTPLNLEQQQTLDNAEDFLPLLLVRSLRAIRENEPNSPLAPCTLSELSEVRSGAEMRLAAHVLGVSAQYSLADLMAFNFTDPDRYQREWIFGMLVSMGTLEDQRSIFTDLISTGPISHEKKNIQHRRRQSVLATLSSTVALSFLPLFLESSYFEHFNLRVLLSRLNSGDAIQALPLLVTKFENSPELSPTARLEIGTRAAKDGISVPLHIRRDILSALPELITRTGTDTTATLWPLILTGLGSSDNQIVGDALFILEKCHFPLSTNLTNAVFNALIGRDRKEPKNFIASFTQFLKMKTLAALLNLDMRDKLNNIIVTELEKMPDAEMSTLNDTYGVSDQQRLLLETMYAITQLLSAMRNHSHELANHTVRPSLTLVAPWLLRNKKKLEYGHFYSHSVDVAIQTIPLIAPFLIQPLLEHALNPQKPIPALAHPIMTLTEGRLQKPFVKLLCSKLSIPQARSFWPTVLAAGLRKNSERKEVIATIAIEIFTLLQEEIAPQAIRFFRFLLIDPEASYWSDLCPAVHIIAQRARFLTPPEFDRTFNFLRRLCFQIHGLFDVEAIIALRGLIPHCHIDQLKSMLIDMQAILNIPHADKSINDRTAYPCAEAIKTIATLLATLSPKPNPAINDTLDETVFVTLRKLKSPYVVIFNATLKALPHLIKHCALNSLFSIQVVPTLLSMISNPPQAENFYGVEPFPNIPQLVLKILPCVVTRLQFSDIKNLLNILNDPALINKESVHIATVLNALLKHLRTTRNEEALKEFTVHRNLRVLCGTQIPSGRNSIFSELSAEPSSKALKVGASNEPILRYAVQPTAPTRNG